MNINVQTITPDLAKHYLLANTDNYRRLDKNKVKAYASDIKSGRWQLNGEAIKFSKSGKLADGQHRLHAIVEADTPATMVVVSGVDDSAVSTYDINKPRNTVDILRNRGVDNYAANSVVCAAALVILSGQFDGHNTQISKAEIVDYIQANKERLSTAYSLASRSHDHVASRSTVLLAVYQLLKNGMPIDELADFIGVVNSGFPVDGRECSPAIVLRNFLISVKEWNKAGSRSAFRKLQYSATIDAFNDFIMRRKRTRKYQLNEQNMNAFYAFSAIEKANGSPV